jgi:16S rRNA processing protein RimM
MIIGEVAGAFGVKGEIKVRPLTDYPERFSQLERVFLGASHREYAVERSRAHGERILLKLRGIDTPEAVTAMGHVDIAVRRADAVPLEQGEYYLDQLVGVGVRTTDDRELGTITDILRTGSNDVWVVGRGQDQILVPAIADAVQEINLDERYAVVHPWILQFEE